MSKAYTVLENKNMANRFNIFVCYILYEVKFLSW